MIAQLSTDPQRLIRHLIEVAHGDHRLAEAAVSEMMAVMEIERREMPVHEIESYIRARRRPLANDNLPIRRPRAPIA